MAFVPSKSPFELRPELRSYLEREFAAVARALNETDGLADDADGPIVLAAGIYPVSSNFTFTNRVTFQPGAILKPDSGVVISFDKFPEASPSEQIFDLSAALTGLAIALPPSNDTGRMVPAAWYGAIPALNAVKSDQNVELQYAIDSVDRNDQGGGVIQLLGGFYYMAAGITVKNNITLRGETCRTTTIRPSPTAWGADTTLVTFYRTGDVAQFNSRLEDMMISGDGVAAVTALIHARSWNEHCGLTRCLVREFMKTGLRVSDYFGGAATAQIQSVEFFAHASATDADQAGVDLEDPGFTTGWHQFLVNHVVSVGNVTNGSTKYSGIKAAGRVRVICQGGLHAEAAAAVVYLAGSSRFEGIGPQAGGNADVVDVFSLAADWDAADGIISCTPPAEGGATGMLVNDAGPGAGLALGGTLNPLVYP